MSKILKILIIILLFIGFFEVGLFSSYTIVTSEAPDVNGLINMQLDVIFGIFSPENVNEVLIKDPTPINISNKQEAAFSLESISGVDGINIDSMNITTYDDKDSEELNVTIESLGYSSPNSTSGQIVISQIPSYKIIANGNAINKNGKLELDPNSLVIVSILKLY